MTLPRRPSNDDLTAFGFAGGLLAAAAVAAGVLTQFGSGLQATAAGFGALALGSGAGLLYPRALAGPYRIWNGLARRVASLGQKLVLIVTFGVFMIAAGAGSLFERRGRPGQTGWRAKSTPALREQEGHVQAGSVAATWSLRLRRWSRGKPSRWSVFLLPYLALLSGFEGRESARPAEDIYTLY